MTTNKGDNTRWVVVVNDWGNPESERMLLTAQEIDDLIWQLPEGWTIDDSPEQP